MRIGLSLAATEPRYNLLAQNIQALFADGSQGWFYDNQDLTTLYQDSAGTTPVTAVEQSVGLQLDKSRGLVLGDELITPAANRDFSSDTGYWTKGTGWAITGGAAVLTGDGTGALLSRSGVFTVGKRYRISFDVTATGGNIGFQNGSGIHVVSGNSGTLVAYWQADTDVLAFKRVSGVVNGTIDNVSVRELPGNHRYQTTSGSRPVWSKRVNRLTKTEQFDDAAWGKAAVTVTANATTAPDNTATADLWSNTSTTYPSVFQSSVPVSANTTYVFTVFAKVATHNVVSLELRFASGDDTLSDATYNLTTLAVTTFAAGATATCTDVGNGWRRLTLTRTNPSSGATVIGIIGGSAINNGDVLSTGLTFYIWGADLRPANQATGLLPLYQRVNTATDYDTNGFPGYLKADGTDDFLVTNSIDFSATDKITLCAGVRKLNDGTFVITELGGGTSNTFSFINGFGLYSFVSRGSSSQIVSSPSNYFSPITNVVTGIGSISTDDCLLRVNGAQVASNAADQGTGNYSNNPVYFFRRTGTILPFSGEEYSNIAVGKLLTADQLTALETYVNGATRAY